MLFCCHRYFHDTEKKYLADTLSKTKQILEYGECPICKEKKVCYTYKSLTNEKKEVTKKGKKAQKLIKELLTQPYYEYKSLKIKQGTKNNMFWLYNSNGVIKDFNNEVKGHCNSYLNITTDIPQEGIFLL